MNINPYIGHSLQISGVEETRLMGGKGGGNEASASPKRFGAGIYLVGGQMS